MKAKEMAMAASTLRYIGLTSTADTLDAIKKEWPLRKLDAASVHNMVTIIIYCVPVIPTPRQFFNDNDNGDDRIGISWKYKDDSDYKIIFNSDYSADFSAKANDGSGVHAEGRLHAADALNQLLKFLQMRKNDLKQKEMKTLKCDINECSLGHTKWSREIYKQDQCIEKLKRRIEEKSKQKTDVETKDASKQEATKEDTS